MPVWGCGIFKVRSRLMGVWKRWFRDGRPQSAACLEQRLPNGSRPGSQQSLGAEAWVCSQRGEVSPLLRRAYAAAKCSGVCSDRPSRGVDTSRFETDVLFRLCHSRLGAPCTASWECLCGDSRSCDGGGGCEKGLSPIGQNEGVCCKKMQQIGAVREVCAEVLRFAQRTANKCAPLCAKKRPPGEPGDAKSV